MPLYSDLMRMCRELHLALGSPVQEGHGSVQVGPEGTMKMVRWFEHLYYAVRLNTRTGCPGQLWMPIPGNVQGQVG